jgi:hypothetical protein
MKELFKLLSNVFNFFTEKRFIYQEGPKPEPHPSIEELVGPVKEPKDKPDLGKDADRMIADAVQKNKDMMHEEKLNKIFAANPDVVERRQEAPKTAKAEKGTPLDRGKKAGEQLARTEALTPSGEVRAAVNKLDSMLLAAMGGEPGSSRRGEVYKRLPDIKDQIATLANNIRASIPNPSGHTTNPSEVNQFLSQVRDVIKDHNPNKESPGELKNKIAALAYKIKPTSI